AWSTSYPPSLYSSHAGKYPGQPSEYPRTSTDFARTKDETRRLISMDALLNGSPGSVTITAGPQWNTVIRAFHSIRESVADDSAGRTSLSGGTSLDESPLDFKSTA